MAKQALCIISYSDLQKVTTGEIEVIDTKFYDRTICEDPVNELLQLIPYVLFYSIDEDNGRIHFLQYKRASQGGDERLLSKTSIGFGGHIDSEEDLTYKEVTIGDNGNTYYMTQDDLISTCIKTATREIIEEMGRDVLNEYSINIKKDSCFFFTGDREQDVNKVHIGLGIPVNIDMDTFNKILQDCKDTINKEEIEMIDDLSVRLDMIVEDMNLNYSLNLLLNELVQNSNLEDWSAICIAYIIPRILNNMFGHIKYQDILALAKSKTVEKV